MVRKKLFGTSSRNRKGDLLDGFYIAIFALTVGICLIIVAVLYDSIGEQWSGPDSPLSNSSASLFTEEMGAKHGTVYDAMFAIGAIRTNINENGIDINFDEVSDSLARLTGNAEGLTIAWEEMLQAMFQDYTQFETDIKTATDAIAELLYFDIDLDTTQADEKINASIVAMQDYMETLSPESQAFTDAGLAITGLITEYEKLGLSVSEGAAIEFNTQLATEAIAALQSDADTLFIDTFAQEASVNLEIGDAINKISTIERDIDGLQNGSVVINADTSNATTAIGTVSSEYSTLETQVNINPLNLGFGSAELVISRIQSVNNLLNSVGSLRIIDIDYSSISDAIYEVRTLAMELAYLPTSKTITINYVETGGSFHEGGTVLHTGGIVPVVAHDGMGIGTYQGRREVPAVLLAGEQVIQPNVSAMSSPAQWDSFRRSGNPDELSGGSNRQPMVIISEPGPLTNVRFTDKATVPRTDERNRYNASSLL